MLVREATEKDFDRMMEIYALAREFMARQADGRVVGAFYFAAGPDI